MPRNKMVVITGLSGSGKSSLAFDTLYAEGQRRYMESFSAYARQFLGSLERPDVDKITGLSPVISIEQKTAGGNPRSTVGTATEIYDFMRLLFARAGMAYSYMTGKRMVRMTDDQIVNRIAGTFIRKEVELLAPVVKGRKGHYRELFENVLQMGFLKVRVNGEVMDIRPGMKLDRYKTHDIEVLVDQLLVTPESVKRLANSVRTGLRQGKGSLMVLESKSGKVAHYSRHLMCPDTGISYDEPAPNSFSFNSPYGACPRCNGLGQVSEVDPDVVVPDRRKTIRNGGIAPLGKYKNNWIFAQVAAIGKKYGFDLNTPLQDIQEEALNVMLYGSDEVFVVNREYITGNKSTYSLTFEGIAAFIAAQVNEYASAGLKRWAVSFMQTVECPECQGARLKKESLHFRIGDMNIAALASMDLNELNSWVANCHEAMNERQQAIATGIIREISKRINFLNDVGLEYLTLNRTSKSLSGGESQRIRLATQIGSQLVGVMYILDEPSIGLHQRDNEKLIHSLHELRDLGNSVLVVEHDKETILAADHVIDLGPGAGVHGGRVVAEGTPATIMQSATMTADYMNGTRVIDGSRNREGNGRKLTLRGASGNNLRNVTVDFPLGKFICVSGVSGSGKSSLINETLYPILNRHFYRAVAKPLPYKSVSGLQHVDKVIEIDQSPIGRTPRSNPATYSGVFTDIRNLFAGLRESKIRGYPAGWFSFNVKGGRCETCQGAGMKVIEMNFLPNVYVHCETCNGRRYHREILEIRYRGKSISDVLAMPIEQAVDFFENLPSIRHKVKTLQDVGLGYITLGQQSTTLSGGEAQRVKLAAELAKRDTGNTIYILDEPTTGLHFEDVRILLDVLHRLADKGNTVLVIEHNMDVIRAADHVIDLGPGGGQAGGEVIFTGPVSKLLKHKGPTATYMRKESKILPEPA